MNFRHFFRAAALCLALLPLTAAGQRFSPEIQFATERGTPGLATFEAGSQPGLYEKMDALREIFRLQEDDELRLERAETDELGFVHEKYRQWHQGIKVEHGTCTVHGRAGLLTAISADFYPLKNVVAAPAISESAALAKALQFIDAQTYKWEIPEEGFALPTGELVFVQDYLGGTGAMRLAWKFDIYAQQPVSRDRVYVDAQTGAILLKDAVIKHTNQLGTAATRYSGSRPITTDSFSGGFRLREAPRGTGLGIETYDLNKGTSYAAAVDFVDNDNDWTAAEWNNADKDNAALDAHWGAEMTYDYWIQKHNRNSFDNQGSVLKSYVHYSVNYDNAFWDGLRMTYGDGGSVFTPLTCMDVCAHEIGHGVCEHTCNLVYSSEPGALNEALSDIWGAAVEKFADPSKQTWLIGEEIVIGGGALRYMNNPNLANDPDTYLGTFWYSGTADNGGVHTNSGVLNYFFYLLSEGGAGTNDLGNAFTVAGIGIEDAAKIVYRAESLYMNSTTTYPQVRPLLIQASTDLFGASNTKTQAVWNAMYAVGIGDAWGACPQPVSPVAYNITNTSAMINWTAPAGAATYKLEYKTTAGSTWTVLPGLTATTHTITGLAVNTNYHFRAKTYCTGGDSSVYSPIRPFKTQTNTACAEQYELNNTFATAASFPLNLSKTALIQTNVDEDYYQFTITPAQAVTISMTTLPGDYDMKLYNSAGTQIAVSENSGTTSETITFSLLAAGTYKIHIYGWAGAFSTNTCYTLKVTAIVPACPDPLEPNETIATALPIPTGTSTDAAINSTTDNDYYSFTVNALSNLDIALTSLPANYDLRLYDAGGALLGSSQNLGTTSENIALSAMPAGTYVIQVNGVLNAFSNADCYTLTPTVAPAACPDPFEPNDAQAAAATLNSGSAIDANIGTTTDVDWFKIAIGAPSTLAAALTSLPANYDLELFDAGGVSLAASTNGGTADENLTYTVYTPGDYFLKINGVSGAFSLVDCYNLLATATALPICPDPFEPNDAQATAATLTSGTAIDASIGSATDVDWFKLAIAAPSSISATLTSLPANFDLELFDAGGALLASSTNAGTADESISYPAAIAAGDYFLKVSGAAGAFNISDCYTLLGSTAALPLCTDPFEPNETLPAAATLTSGTAIEAGISSATDADWFKITIAAPSSIAIALTSLPANYDLELYSAAGILLDASVNLGTANENLLYTAYATGTYYLRVSGAGGVFDVLDCYNLLATATALPPCPDIFEPNNSLATAKEIYSDSLVSASVGTATDADWFKISIAAPALLIAELSSLPANYDMRLYSAAGTLLASSLNTGTADEIINYTATASGFYYLKITTVGGVFNIYDCYALLALVTPVVLCPDPFEPNNTQATAATLTSGTAIDAPIGSTTDADWFKISVAAPATLAAALTSLPANFDLRLYNASGSQLATSLNAGTTDESISYIVSTSGDYFLKVSGASGAYELLDCYTLQATVTPACTDVWEPNNTLAAAKIIPTGMDVDASLSASSDKDYFKFANTAATPNIRVTLSDLPSNYDLRLYRSSTLLATSSNAGATTEVITYNTSTVSTNYKVYVYRGTGGAASLSCYNLFVELSATPLFAPPRLGDRSETPAVSDAGLSIFPSPASDWVRILAPASSDSEATEVAIFDHLGRQMQVFRADAAAADLELAVDVSTFAPGIYLVQIQQGARRLTGRFVVNH